MKRRFHTAQVRLNGELYCDFNGDKDVVIEARHHAAKLRERQAAIAKSLKIRDKSKVEVRVL